MKLEKYYTFNITARPVRTAPKPGNPATLQYTDFVKYKSELAAIAKAKRFKLGSAFKIIFILPISGKLSPKDQMALIGEPHTTGGYPLVKLVEGVRQALLGEDDFHRCDASKYWGEVGKIIIKNIQLDDYDYLRQIK